MYVFERGNDTLRLVGTKWEGTDKELVDWLNDMTVLIYAVAKDVPVQLALSDLFDGLARAGWRGRKVGDEDDRTEKRLDFSRLKSLDDLQKLRQVSNIFCPTGSGSRMSEDPPRLRGDSNGARTDTPTQTERREQTVDR